jgi:signal transduction histidine kinase
VGARPTPGALREWYRGLSLHARFALNTSLGIALLFAAAVPGVLYLQRSSALGQARERGLLLTRVFAHSSVQAVVTDDFLVMRQIVDSIATDPDVLYAMILDLSGRVLVHHEVGEAGKVYRDPVSVRAVTTDRPLVQETRQGRVAAYDLAVPIYVMNDRRAIARIGLSLERERAAIARMRNTILGLAAAALAAGVGLAAWQARSVSRPVGDLVWGAHEITRGNLGHRIAPQGGDELGQLALAFNRMTEAVHALLETSRALSSTLDPDEVLRSVAQHALDLVKADLAAIAPYDRDAREARIQLVLGARTERLRSLVVTPGRGIGGAVLATGEPARVGTYLDAPGIVHDPRYDDACRQEGIRASAAVPITLREDIVGLLWVAHRTAKTFTDEDVDALTRMAGQAAIAMENARLYADTRVKSARLEGLLRVSRAITATLDPGRIVQEVLGAVSGLMEGAAARLWVPRAGDSRLVLLDHGAPDSSRWIEPGRGLVGLVASTRRPVVVEDLRGDPRVVHRDLVEREGLVSFLGLPLLREDQLLGVLAIATRARRRFTEDEIALLASFAQQAAISLENARLYQDLRASNEGLVAAQEELVRKTRMAALGQIAAVVAHEARNPLGALSNCVQLLRANPFIGGEDAELLAIVQAETQRLNEIVSDFLAFGRPRPPQFDEVDLPEAVHATFALLRRDDRCPGSVNLVSKFDPDLPPVRGDHDQLRQVFWNLFLNAVQAMPGGGELAVETRSLGDRVEVSVRDSGPGIPAEVLPRIFEPFFTTRAGGTGLGLAIVRRIVEEHGGHIAVHSEQGVGTWFALSLPVQPRDG